MARRVLITGGAGFVGQWLSRALLECGWSVYSGHLNEPDGPGVLNPSERSAVQWLPLDVTDDESIARACEAAQPDRVVHLAGIAFAPEANASPVRAFDVNAVGALRLLRQLSTAGNVRVLVVGSAEQYGAQESTAYPISERATLRPLTPYAAAKAAQELIALQVQRSSGLEVICTRSFNHSGVGHGGSYLLPTLVARVKALRTKGGPLRIGNADVVRDYTHVRDVVDAYLRLLERGQPGEVYNVCSGRGMTVRAMAERVLNRAGVTADITSDSTLLRAIDVPILVGDNSKLRTATGWEPVHTIDDIIDDLLHAAPR